jgi:hypothetical protein
MTGYRWLIVRHGRAILRTNLAWVEAWRPDLHAWVRAPARPEALVSDLAYDVIGWSDQLVAAGDGWSTSSLED